MVIIDLIDTIVIMQIINYSLGELQANCYFLIDDDQCIIVDPADDAPFILEELQRKRLRLLGLFATHGHFDHIMAAGEIQLSLDVPFYFFREDLSLVKRLNETADYFLGHSQAVIYPKKLNIYQ